MPGAREGQYAPGGAIAVGVEVAPQAVGTPVWLEPAIDSLRGRSRRYRQAKQDQVFRAPVLRHCTGEQVCAGVRPREQEQIDKRPNHRSGPEHYLGFARGGPAILPDDGGLQPSTAERESRVAWRGPCRTPHPYLIGEENYLGQDGQRRHHEQRGSCGSRPMRRIEVRSAGNYNAQRRGYGNRPDRREPPANSDSAAIRWLPDSGPAFTGRGLWGR
jgi:hypothetical protein